jgi:hypothetical protein
MSIKLRFLYWLILFSLLVFILVFFLFTAILSEKFLPVFYIVFPYFFVLTYAGRLLLIDEEKGLTANFNMRYFFVRWIKLFLHLIFIVIYLFNDSENIPAFILTFLGIYIFYSVFDVYTLSVYLQKKSN